MDDAATSNPSGHADPRIAEAWREHRQRLMDVAYRMLGSVSDAEDVVQDAYARLMRNGVDGIDDVRGWLVTVTSRLCLDQLRSARSRRTSYIGPWLPEPVVDAPSLGADPADRITLDDSVRMALLVVLEQLSPAERTAFVLHDVFQMSFDDVASIVGRSPAACRQLASRARRHIEAEGEPARFQVNAAEQRRLAERFAAAANSGDLEALLEVLDPDVVLRADRGAVSIGASRVVRGAANVARGALAFSRLDIEVRPALVNGAAGTVTLRDGRPFAIAGFTIRNRRIVEMDVLADPEGLRQIDLTILD
jgi:RNA polymerase sigma-70 factor (ECF subfamily)